MRIKFLAAILFYMSAISLIGQEKEPVRKTFGVSMSVLPLDETHHNYIKKIGFVKRRCFKGFVLQSEFNVMFQNDPSALLTRNKNGRYDVKNDQIFESSNFSSSQRYFNTQWTLSKGWTNDKINLYVGAGLSISQSEMKYSASIWQITPMMDTLNDPYLDYEWSDKSIGETAKYLHLGIVAKASAEFKLVDNVTLLVQISPEISYGSRYKSINPNISKVNYTVLTSGLLEIGIHYKL